MIQIKHLTLQRGQKILLKDVSITLNPCNKIGLVGANGVGKSSLFALLQKECHADAGSADLPANWVIAHVAQETPSLPQSALHFVLDGDRELRALEAKLVATETAGDGIAQGHVHDDMVRIEAYSAPARAARLLSGLGFDTEQHQRPVSSFSGGWRMRLNLAQALMCRSDLLLLDEPTNHLDIETVLWLEEWLKNYPGTLLMISHDRDFLDAICSHIVEMAEQSMTLYSGNYSQFEHMRAERLARQDADFNKQQREIAHLENFIRRFKAKASKARQAQGRVKALEKLERIAPAHVHSPFSFHFTTPNNLPNPLLRLDDLCAGYDGHPILSQVSLSVEAGSRIGLLGINGAGKSTLVKILAGELTPLSGQCTVSPSIRIGYFAQHQLDHLRLDESPLWHLQKKAPQAREQELRAFLGGFNFRGDTVNDLVGPMSGGEKARLALALIVWDRPHLLLLDEPTNHLDLEMRHALTMALQDFGGALLVVSHDRSLLETSTDMFWLVAEGTVRPFDGDLEDYRQWRLSQLAEAARPSSQEAQSANRKTQKRTEAESRQRRAQLCKPLLQNVRKLERELETLGTEKAELDAFLASAEAYAETNRDHLALRLKRQGEVSAQLAQVEEAWLAAQEALEALERTPPTSC